MPRLLLFAPCEKLIVDEDGNPTLFTVIQNISVSVPAGQEIPSDVMTPQGWDVLTLWHPEPGDEGKTFHERLEFEQPGGSVPIRGTVKFMFSDGKTQRNKTHVQGFPVGRAGVCWLKLWLHAEGADPSPNPIATFPISVTHVRPT